MVPFMVLPLRHLHLGRKEGKKEGRKEGRKIGM
jgi:hypothetical protein